jgi:hypothetical protein
MGADTERQMLTRLAPDVENVSIRRELAMIAVGGADEHHHDAPLRHAPAVVLDITGDVPRDVWSRRLVAQQLLARDRESCRI